MTKVLQMLAHSIRLIAIPVVAIAIATLTQSDSNAQPRPQRPPMVTGPLPLPILAALPTRDDMTFYAVQEVPHGTIERCHAKYTWVGGV